MEFPDSPTYESLRRAARKALRVENPDEYEKAYAEVLKDAHKENGELLSKDEALRRFHALYPTSDARFLEQWTLETRPLEGWTPRTGKYTPTFSSRAGALTAFPARGAQRAEDGEEEEGAGFVPHVPKGMEDYTEKMNDRKAWERRMSPLEALPSRYKPAKRYSSKSAEDDTFFTEMGKLRVHRSW